MSVCCHWCVLWGSSHAEVSILVTGVSYRIIHLTEKKVDTNLLPCNIIIIIIIALKGAIQDFFNLLTAPRTVSNMYKWPRAQSCANHVQHIERISHASVMLRATWYEGTAQLLSLTELKSHLLELYFIG